MNIYENIIILDASLSDEEIKSASDKISDLIVNSGGQMLKVDNWGKKKLAYEINKNKTGVYILYLFKAPSSTIKKIEDFFKVFDPVIKFMVIKLSKKQIAAMLPDVAVPPSVSDVAVKEGV